MRTNMFAQPEDPGHARTNRRILRACTSIFQVKLGVFKIN